MRRLGTAILTFVMLITMISGLTSCKTDTEKAIEAYDKSIKVAEQQTREAEKKLGDIQIFRHSQ